jgi:hypothetical protein
MQLPHVTTAAQIDRFQQRDISTIKDLQALPLNKFQTLLQDTLRTPQHITEFTQAFRNLPNLSLSLSLLSRDETQESWNAISSSGNEIFDVKPARELKLEITITRGGGAGGRAAPAGGSEDKIFSPRYHKSKSISWWLVLGTASGELLAMKRIGSVGMSSHSLLFSSPSEEQRELSTDYLVFLIPDSVYGIEALGQFHLKTR